MIQLLRHQEHKTARPTQPKPQQKPMSSTRIAIVCDYCRKPGHIAKNCYKNPESTHNKGGKGAGKGMLLLMRLHPTFA